MKIKDVVAQPLAMTGALTAVCAVSGSLATDPKSRWYRALKKPAWKPPGQIFPVVWSALFTSIAVSTAVALEELESRDDHRSADALRAALVVNLLLNQSWSWVFFKGRKLAPATVVAALLAASSIDLARRAGAARSGPGLALVPYAAWCSFATVLTNAIRVRNDG